MSPAFLTQTRAAGSSRPVSGRSAEGSRPMVGGQGCGWPGRKRPKRVAPAHASRGKAAHFGQSLRNTSRAGRGPHRLHEVPEGGRRRPGQECSMSLPWESRQYMQRSHGPIILPSSARTTPIVRVRRAVFHSDSTPSAGPGGSPGSSESGNFALRRAQHAENGSIPHLGTKPTERDFAEGAWNEIRCLSVLSPVVPG